MENKTFLIKHYNIEYRHPETNEFCTCYTNSPTFAKSKRDAIKIANDQLAWNEDHLKEDCERRAILIDRHVVDCEYDYSTYLFKIGDELILTQNDDIVNAEYLVDKFLD